MCVCVFVLSKTVKSKEAGDRERESTMLKRERERSVRDERSGEEACFILYCEGLLLINVSWSLSVGAE